MREYPLTTDGKCRIDVCECGHGEIYHILHSKVLKKNCRMCVCPNYNFELKVEWFEYLKQCRLRIEREEKTGFHV
jgi:hypothetical protein